MPYTGRCINCNWRCLGQTEGEVKGQLRKHSEPRHRRWRYVTSRISKEEYYVLSKLWDNPQYRRLCNSKPKIISAEGAKAGS